VASAWTLQRVLEASKKIDRGIVGLAGELR
jgi:hypothetical protein